MPHSDIDHELVSAAHAGSAAQVSELLACGADPESSRSAALRAAAEFGHVECARLLLTVSEAKDRECEALLYESEALRGAAYNGHAECVRMLLSVSDAKAEDSWPLLLAAGNGHVECLRVLLPVSDPMADGSLALRDAARNGHEECVRLLLPGSDPKAGDFRALRAAAHYGRVGCVRLLLAASSPLCEIGGLLEKVIESGQAKMAALLIGEEPRLLDGVDLSKCLAAAREKDHMDMAALLWSIIEQKELLAVEQDRPRRRGLARI